MENDKVVPLRKGSLIPGIRHEPDQEVIRELEYLIGAARAGELQGFAYASLWTDKSTGSRYVGHISRAEVGSLFAVMSRMNNQIDKDIQGG